MVFVEYSCVGIDRLDGKPEESRELLRGIGVLLAVQGPVCALHGRQQRPEPPPFGRELER
ncbi:unnamed protein product [Cladocopium goreaui]|uniref:Uncharacterized protein n=1 Tax=Cladocopium goreaui TaxID=2562237 RepID=A0A9P1FKJ9_9DINO|nr:unnamed protein product [Cladocopium goreaui]